MASDYKTVFCAGFLGTFDSKKQDLEYSARTQALKLFRKKDMQKNYLLLIFHVRFAHFLLRTLVSTHHVYRHNGYTQQRGASSQHNTMDTDGELTLFCSPQLRVVHDGSVFS